jgi:hypothetical protein
MSDHQWRMLLYLAAIYFIGNLVGYAGVYLWVTFR